MPGPRFLDPSSIPLKRQSGGNIWATLVHITQGVTVVAVLSGLMLFFVPVLNKAHRLQQQKVELQTEIAAAQDTQQQLLLETEHMKNDPAYVEHIARDRLNMGRPGETIIRFDPYVPAPAPAKSDTTAASGDGVSN
jgi:cell division protein FtsL